MPLRERVSERGLMTSRALTHLFLVSAVADDLWLAFCSYVSSTYYLIYICILFGTPSGRQKKN